MITIFDRAQQIKENKISKKKNILQSIHSVMINNYITIV